MSCNPEYVPDIYQKYLSHVWCQAWILVPAHQLLQVDQWWSARIFRLPTRERVDINDGVVLRLRVDDDVDADESQVHDVTDRRSDVF